MSSQPCPVTFVVPDLRPKRYWWPILHHRVSSCFRLGSKGQEDIRPFTPRALQWDLWVFQVLLSDEKVFFSLFFFCSSGCSLSAAPLVPCCPVPRMLFISKRSRLLFLPALWLSAHLIFDHNRSLTAKYNLIFPPSTIVYNLFMLSVPLSPTKSRNRPCRRSWRFSFLSPPF